jgi:ribosomal protein L11 methyltransferase
MYSLLLTCAAEETDLLTSELWEAGTAGVQELDQGGKRIVIATFEDNDSRSGLLARFAQYSPEWRHTDAIDWIEHTRLAWPAISIGKRLFLAPPWNRDLTPAGRERIVHNPGLACGTGEHPCTQLALMALERCITPGCRVVDVGTGSGILAIAALYLGAEMAAGVDTDAAALQVAAENFRLNDFTPTLFVGSGGCLASGCSDVTVANLSGTVLLSIMDELTRITRATGCLILTGFPKSELGAFESIFPGAEVSQLDEWRCVLVTYS